MEVSPNLMNEITPQCTYQKLADNLYEINIHKATRQGVQEFFQYMKAIYAEAIAADNLPVRMVIIAPPRTPLPVVPLTAELKAWTALYGKTPSRSVILYEGAFATLVDVLMRNFGSRTTTMRVFAPQRREESLVWLMSDISKSVS